MKRQFSTNLIFCISLVVALPVVCAQPQQITAQQKAEAVTGYFVKLLDRLVEKNIISTLHLQSLRNSPELINPMTTTDRDQSSQHLIYFTELENYVKSGKKFIDFARVKTWIAEKIAQLERTEETRKQVHEDTREIHRPMRFVPIPAGKYVDQITHETFEIPEGIEFQDTPVTQWQWAEILAASPYANPLSFEDGYDSEVWQMGHRKITMRFDAPVINIGMTDIEAFLEELNENDQDYSYNLASIQEYQAVLQKGLGPNWIEKVKQLTLCAGAKTCSTRTGSSIELNGKRIWGIVGNVWQWTRDWIEDTHYWNFSDHMFASQEKTLLKKSAHLVFGCSYADNNLQNVQIKDLVRPIIYDLKSYGKTVGFRLIRYKKSPSQNLQNTIYLDKQLPWNQADGKIDSEWQWDLITKKLLFQGDEFRWMIEHKNEYPEKTRTTLDALLKQLPPAEERDQDYRALYLTELDHLDLSGNNIQDIKPLVYLKHLTELHMDDNNIEDLSPLSHMNGLEVLYAGNNKIQDISPLSNLTKLTKLWLDKNRIKDLNPLANLTNLLGLWLDHNKIQDLTSLANLTQLIELDLGDNLVQIVSPLQKLFNLRELYLSKNQIRDISPLAQLTNLTRLVLDHNPILDFSPLKKLKHLEKLWLDKKQAEQLHVKPKKDRGWFIMYETSLLPGVEIGIQ